MKYLVSLLLILSSAYANAEMQKVCKNSKSQVSILVDLSEALDQPTSIAFSTLSKKIVESLTSGGVLNLYSIKHKAEDVSKPDYEICIPDFDDMKGNKYRERARQRFENEVSPILEKLSITLAPANKSPIIENIFKISHATFLKGAKNENNTMIVISDLVQYSELVNFYKEIPNFANFIKNPQSNSWMPQAKDVKLNLILLSNSNSAKLDIKKIRSFWLDYSRHNFKQCGFSGINEAAVSYKNEC